MKPTGTQIEFPSAAAASVAGADFWLALSATGMVEGTKSGESKVIAGLQPAPVPNRAVEEGSKDRLIMSRNSPSPKIRALAQRLLDYEARTNSPDPNMPAVLCVSEKLRHPLSTLAGISGFRSLLTRALTLAKAESPSLVAVQVKHDGSLEGLGSGDQDAEAGVILIAQLLELLVTFIGEGLVMNLVADSWPNVAAINSTGEKRS